MSPLEMTPRACEELVAAVEAANGQPVRVTDSRTNKVYVLTCREVEAAPAADPDPQADTVPAGVRAAQRAFWEALPAMLLNRKLRGKWVVFGPTGLLRAHTYAGELYRVLGEDRGNRFIGRVEPHDQPPWEPEPVFWTDWGMEPEDDEPER